MGQTRPHRVAFAASATIACSLGSMAFADAPTAHDVAGMLGFTPETLVMAGVSGEDAELMLGRLNAVSSLREQLGQQLEARDAAGQSLSEARALLRTGVTTGGVRSQLASAQSSLSAAESNIGERIGLLWAVAALEMTEGQIESIQTISSSRGHTLPGAFRVLEKSDGEWTEVRQALIAERRSLRTGETLDEGFADLLDTIREDSDVMAAQTDLQNALGAMQGAFEE